MSIPIDPSRAAAQRKRVDHLRREAAHHRSQADSCEAAAHQIERVWGLSDLPAEPEGPPAYESFKANPPSLDLLPPL